MTLQELIISLKTCQKGVMFSKGFSLAHSYRGSYCELAVEPTTNVPVEDMIKTLEEALNKTFMGYKGGEFVMHEEVYVYLAYEGCIGQQIIGWGVKSYEGFTLLLEDD